FLHIDAASIRAHTFSAFVGFNEFGGPIFEQRFGLQVIGGLLDLPIGDSIALPDISLTTAMSWSHTVVDVLDLDLGIIDIDGGDWHITFNGSRLAVDLVGTANVDVNIPGYRSDMTANDFDF